jgi:hypothetical protein
MIRRILAGVIAGTATLALAAPGAQAEPPPTSAPSAQSAPALDLTPGTRVQTRTEGDVKTVTTTTVEPVNRSTAVLACPQAGTTTTRAIHETLLAWMEVRTGWVWCDWGAIRLQSWRYDDSENVRRTYGHGQYGGNPATKWFPGGGGGAVNAVNGYPSWYDGRYIVLNNAACADYCTVVVWGRLDIAGWADWDFLTSELVGPYS